MIIGVSPVSLISMLSSVIYTSSGGAADPALLERLLAPAALWARIQTSPKNPYMGDITREWPTYS
jgi:hypothetical protein